MKKIYNLILIFILIINSNCATIQKKIKYSEYNSKFFKILKENKIKNIFIAKFYSLENKEDIETKITSLFESNISKIENNYLTIIKDKELNKNLRNNYPQLSKIFNDIDIFKGINNIDAVIIGEIGKIEIENKKEYFSQDYRYNLIKIYVRIPVCLYLFSTKDSRLIWSTLKSGFTMKQWIENLQYQLNTSPLEIYSKTPGGLKNTKKYSNEELINLAIDKLINKLMEEITNI